MFDYIHSPELKADDLKIHLSRFNYQAQLLLDASLFFELGNELLKAQMAGKFFEMVILMPKGFRPLELANLMHRLVLSGAHIGYIEGEFIQNDIEIFSIFDNKVLVSNVLFEIEKDIMTLVLKKHESFESILGKSQKVNHSSQQIKIKLSADHYFVPKYQPVQIFWHVENADQIILNPGTMLLEGQGNNSFFIEEDTLFTITAKNTKNKATLSIFIKCLDDAFLKLNVQVYTRDLNDFVGIDPIKTDDYRYAVYAGDLIKVVWNCEPRYQLREAKLGQLENIGQYDTILTEKKVFEFVAISDHREIRKIIEIYPISAEDPVEGKVSIYTEPKTDPSDSPVNNDEVTEKSSWLQRLISNFKK